MTDSDIQGCIGNVTAACVKGWAFSTSEPEQPLKVALYINGTLKSEKIADEPRPALKNNGRHATGHCGYSFTTDDFLELGNESKVQVVAQANSQELTNSPYIFYDLSEIEIDPDAHGAVDVAPFNFIHVPKTSGTSFRVAAERQFTKKRVIGIYGQHSPETHKLALATFYNQNAEKLSAALKTHRAIMSVGHFSYHEMRPHLSGFSNKWAAFLREPAQRVLSDYYHRQRHYGMSMNLHDFIADPRFQNQQAKLLSGLDLNDLYFLGISEKYDLSLQLVKTLTGIGIESIRTNFYRNDISSAYEIDRETMALIQACNPDDFALYSSAVDIFERRAISHGLNE